MTWLIDVQANVVKHLAKIDRKQADRIWHFLEVDLVKMSNPRLKGKALSGDLKGLWRYRIGDYRVICQIKDHELVILIVELGHRKEVYRK